VSTLPCSGEAENPRKNVPKAIRRTFWRILIFYVTSIFIMGLLVPYNDENLLNSSDGSTVSQSPFVIAINRAGVKGLASVVNAVLLIAVWSAGNSDVYASSRVLYALALEGQAPSFFKICTKRGLPIYAVSVTALVFGALSYMTLGGDGANQVFNWLYNISTITGVVAWIIILLTYLRFYYGMKRQGIDRNTLPYKAPWQPYATWVSLVFLMLVALLNGFKVFVGDNWDVQDFIAAYVGVAGVFVFYAIWKCFGGTRTRKRQIFAFTKYVFPLSPCVSPKADSTSQSLQIDSFGRTRLRHRSTGV
jgi:amino acid transporter